ncbi:hypothetical protein ACQP00_01940 [Dactylosporangium sp. CS-047395]|uniref:hypothetical protein n=1 Tax=Dactylosporangium sp. CS-047395 TaxID=3239936 RepID=UPI003D8C3CF5
MTQNMQDLLQQARSDALSAAPPMRRDVDDFVSAGRKRRAKHRLLQGGAAATLTAAAVFAALVIPQALSSAPSAPVGAGATAVPPAYPDAQWTYSLSGYKAGEFTVTAPEHITPGYQELYVRHGNENENMYDGTSGGVAATSPLYSATVTVYRPGVFQPTKFAAGEHVTVNGRPGLYLSDAMYIDSADLAPAPELAWQYTDNAWAVVSSVIGGRYNKADLLKVAGGLTGAAATPATVAIKTTYTPAGYSLTSAGRTDDFPSGASYMAASLRLSKVRPSYASLTEPVDASTGHGPTVRIALYPTEFTDDTHRKPGSAAYCNSGNANLCFRMSADGKYLAEIYADGGASIPQAELLKTLDNLQFADPKQPSTWFPVTEAVPAL